MLKTDLDKSFEEIVTVT